MEQRVLEGGRASAVGQPEPPADTFSPWVEIDVGALVGSPICIAFEDGETVYRAIAREWERGNRVLLCFAAVEGLSSAFMWAAVGQFLETCSKASVMARVRVKDSAYQTRSLFERVLRNAEKFYKNPELVRRILAEELGYDEPEV